MKYTRIVCWLDRAEAKRMKDECKKKNVPVIFAKNYSNFANSIGPTDLIVFSLKKAKYKKTFDLVRSHKTYRFWAFIRLDDMFTTSKEMDLLLEENVHDPEEHHWSQYREDEIVKEFCTAV